MEKERILKWIQNYFLNNGPNSKAIIGISGGIDSTTCAYLLTQALGKDRVIGILMPNGEQHDLNVSLDIVSELGIKYHIININDIYKESFNSIPYEYHDKDLYNRIKINTPARIRANMLYNISDSIGGRVCNTSNLSEDYVGYNTKFGDTVGDFAPLMKLTKTEVKELARELNVPEKFVSKPPEDGLTGLTDEQKLGFNYNVLDKYIRTGIIDDLELKEKIDNMHLRSIHKISQPFIYEPVSDIKNKMEQIISGEY